VFVPFLVSNGPFDFDEILIFFKNVNSIKTFNFPLSIPIDELENSFVISIYLFSITILENCDF
jgi:hypothetical protein